MFLSVYRRFLKLSIAWVKDETLYFAGFAIRADVRWSNLANLYTHSAEDETPRAEKLCGRVKK